jgi:hypothetical protein
MLHRVQQHVDDASNQKVTVGVHVDLPHVVTEEEVDAATVTFCDALTTRRGIFENCRDWEAHGWRESLPFEMPSQHIEIVDNDD